MTAMRKPARSKGANTLTSGVFLHSSESPIYERNHIFCKFCKFERTSKAMIEKGFQLKKKIIELEKISEK